MCGIAVSFAPGGRARPLELSLLQHRGPDAQGSWESQDGSCWLGHTRLSILDLSENGAQPMASASRRRHIVFNGEIYNHCELRAELEGYPWRGTSDTETLLAAHERWGTAMFSRLKGMFAFAVFDPETGSLLLGRDRFGMKPVYYCWRGGEILVSSEVRVLLAAGPVSIDRNGVGEYLKQGAAREECLIWSGIQCLPPGQWLCIDSRGGTSRGSYWPAAPHRRLPMDQPALCVRQLLEYSVEDHLQADVPVASFLSGGIDSSIITALAAQKMSRRLQTFSVAFRENGFDESDVASAVAKRWGTDHTRIELGEDEVLTLVEKAVDHFDLPSVDALNTYIISHKVAQAGIKVALSGLGADELFGGYDVFRQARTLQPLSRIPSVLRSLLSPFGNKGRRLADLPDNASPAAVARWRRRFFTDRELAEFGFTMISQTSEPLWSVPNEDTFSSVSVSELTGYMRDMLLRDSDQMSMTVSLELRLPFLDHELVSFVLDLPSHIKTRGPWSKPLLIEACQDLLPRAVYDRRKMGFSLPMRTWMLGPLNRLVSRGLDSVQELGLLSIPMRRRLCQGFEADQLHWTRIWSWVALGLYLQRQRQVPPVPQPQSPPETVGQLV